MAQSGSNKSNKKVANNLVALSSAAVMAVYSAGYFRTRPAADRFAPQAAERRPALEARPSPVTPVAEARSAASAPAASAPSPVASHHQEQATPKTTPAPEPAPTTTDTPSAPVAIPPVETPVETPAAAPVATPVLAPAPEPAPPVVEHVAQKPEPPPAPPPAPPKNVWKNGTYYGWGTSRHGNIQAAVVVEAGRIASATIAQCLTRYSCSVIGRLPPQVAQRQSPEVDYVSGATQSTNAFYYAVVEALAKAK